MEFPTQEKPSGSSNTTTPPPVPTNQRIVSPLNATPPIASRPQIAAPHIASSSSISGSETRKEAGSLKLKLRLADAREKMNSMSEPRAKVKRLDVYLTSTPKVI